MGTRGIYGYHIEGRDKVTHNHWDSSPSWLGRKVMDYVASHSTDEIKEVAKRIVLVNESSKPTPAQIKQYERYSDLNVSTKSLEDWYCLLRKSQGDLGAFHNGLGHMVDDSLFLSCSLFCEWAYIINLDTEKLEVYRGFNKNPDAPGRYAPLRTRYDRQGYYGVALGAELMLESIREDNVDRIVSEIEKLA